ncbi:Hypothetical predicted protein [Pelobates cultripes]|uniref:Uncharacterized protein n=1 Tax=Pelobates cultripes TaxID=61616 RepID=A0AAD1RKF3_PELCU|nr:Hypothetical predicted protein [Pelobates cultripes]
MDDYISLTIIVSHRQDGVIVDHDVIVETEYSEDKNVSEKYSEILNNVRDQLEEVKNGTCAEENDVDALCVSSVGNITEIQPPSEQEICNSRVGEGFNAFYSAFINSDGLQCISHCDSRSNNLYICYFGTCQIQNVTGPECLDAFYNDQNDKWYEDDGNDEWSERGITNISGSEEDTGNSLSAKENFKPALETVDTTIEVM